MAERLRFSAAAAYRHLRQVDPVVGRLIEEHGPYRPRPAMDHYESLLRTVMFQQLNGRAASAIQERWMGLYGGRYPTPSELLATTDEAFRAVGVSRQKSGYLRDIAERMLSGALDFRRLDEMSDEAIVEQVTAVKGLGEWSAHMFLMFQLGRPDVLPIGDFGVRNGMRLAYGLREMPSPARAREIGAPWEPYRSVGAWYMWRATEGITEYVSDTEPEATPAG
ncbi:MAG: DNA-3-methyladenine glycosylase 2 family protein [Dehalococcoidia bacterium]|nr:DNA-3-methyladenine glycosylase 2 family protein [Dehalococcoidia bacterium]